MFVWFKDSTELCFQTTAPWAGQNSPAKPNWASQLPKTWTLLLICLVVVKSRCQGRRRQIPPPKKTWDMESVSKPLKLCDMKGAIKPQKTWDKNSVISPIPPQNPYGYERCQQTPKNLWQERWWQTLPPWERPDMKGVHKYSHFGFFLFHICCQQLFTPAMFQFPWRLMTL